MGGVSSNLWYIQAKLKAYMLRSYPTPKYRAILSANMSGHGGTMDAKFFWEVNVYLGDECHKNSFFSHHLQMTQGR